LEQKKNDDSHSSSTIQDLDIAVICANDRSEKLLFDSLTDRGLIYQSISTLLPEKDSFGVIVKLRGGCLDDKPVS
jgi:hypothetical protein